MGSVHFGWFGNSKEIELNIMILYFYRRAAQGISDLRKDHWIKQEDPVFDFTKVQYVYIDI